MNAETTNRSARSLDDPRTGETLTFLETSVETGGERVVMELALAPGARVSPHSHPIVETFSLLKGEIDFELDGKPLNLAPGTEVTVPGGRLHGFKNNSQRPALLRLVATPGPEAEYGLRMKFLLSRDGYIPVPGGARPKDPLVGAVLIHRGGLYFPPVPRRLFRALVGLAAGLGRRIGKERFLLDTYPEYGLYLASLRPR